MQNIKYISPYKLIKGNPTDSGWDLKLVGEKSVVLEPMETTLLHSGVFLELPDNIEAQVRPKSSLSSQGVMVHFGTVDSGYRGEILVAITNLTKGVIMLEVGRKIAQLVFQEKTEVNLQKSDKIDKNTSRGEGGFGSTGKF